MVELALIKLGISYSRVEVLRGLVPGTSPLQTRGPDYLARNEPDSAVGIALMNVTQLEHILITEPRTSARYCRILVAITAERIIARLTQEAVGKNFTPFEVVN